MVRTQLSARIRRGGILALAGMVVIAVGLQTRSPVRSQVGGPAAPRFRPPLPALDGIVKDRTWAIALGKALFWDVAAGSDGMACASCHFSAGTDSRIVGQISPGLLRRPVADTAFGSIADFDGEPLPGATVGVTGSGARAIDERYELRPTDFPLHHLTNTSDRNSPIAITTNDVVSSSGAFESTFGLTAGFSSVGTCGDAVAGVFRAGTVAARQVEPRTTATTINAAFNYRNFWDGRANPIFNGVGVFGPRDIANDPDLRLVVLGEGRVPELASLALPNASLASQALGPPLSALEMSCSGRTFADVARRMLSPALRPLATQKVHRNDSVLGRLVSPSGVGLDARYGYAEMIRRAFDEKYWSAPGTFRISNGQLVTVAPAGVADGSHTQMEMNFSMFWGISIMLYEATLISDQSRFDDWFGGCNPAVARGPGDVNAVPTSNPTVTCRNGGSATSYGLTEQEVLGFALFNRPGPRDAGNPACTTCHSLPLFTEAAFQAGETFVPVERSRIDIPSPLGAGVHDRGFFNIGVTPTSFDVGIGGTDPYGNPLSAARMFLAEQAGQAVVDPTGIGNRCNTPTLVEPGGTPPFPGCPNASPPLLDASRERELVDGGFKTPTLRNIALTPPYFHYAGYSDLRGVVEVYSRGGSHREKSHIDPAYVGNTSGTGPLGKATQPVGGPDFGTNVDFFIRDIRLTDEQIDALVAFMLTLTDHRVQCDEAPFDHPELPVFNGTQGDQNRDGVADDRVAIVPATGAGGYGADGRSELCLPNTGDLFDPTLRNRLTTPR